jgi:hypothetical protein
MQRLKTNTAIVRTLAGARGSDCDAREFDCDVRGFEQSRDREGAMFSFLLCERSGRRLK